MKAGFALFLCKKALLSGVLCGTVLLTLLMYSHLVNYPNIGTVPPLEDSGWNIGCRGCSQTAPTGRPADRLQRYHEL